MERAVRRGRDGRVRVWIALATFPVPSVALLNPRWWLGGVALALVVAFLAVRFAAKSGQPTGRPLSPALSLTLVLGVVAVTAVLYRMATGDNGWVPWVILGMPILVYALTWWPGSAVALARVAFGLLAITPAACVAVVGGLALAWIAWTTHLSAFAYVAFVVAFGIGQSLVFLAGSSNVTPRTWVRWFDSRRDGLL